MNHRFALILLLSTCLTVVPGAAMAADGGTTFRPGSPGIGDPYVPLAGNGGYDVEHYDLSVAYDPDTDELDGRAVIRATATQNLSRFNLDLSGLKVRSVTVDAKPARSTRDGDELVITPRRGLVDGRSFTVEVRYEGVPKTLGDEQLGASGFLQ